MSLTSIPRSLAIFSFNSLSCLGVSLGSSVIGGFLNLVLNPKVLLVMQPDGLLELLFFVLNLLFRGSLSASSRAVDLTQVYLYLSSLHSEDR